MSNKRIIGFQKAGSGNTAMSSNVSRQWWIKSSEVRAALQFLQRLESNNAEYFWKHKVNKEGRLRLQSLFWCDRRSRVNYKQFGDVVALDTTFVKSDKYPLVVFSGVNHHIHTTVFASAIIADETEETYVWLFEQFKEAMEVKSPEVFITNDDIALKNAISRVFPNARHRLCAQQILRNARSKVGDPMMITQFKNLMLSYYAAMEFDRVWDEMVAQFGLEEHSWVRDMYENRNMWATAYFRARCFVGFKATSRCVNVKFGRLARSCHNLVDFLEQFHYCLEDLQSKEVKADFRSVYGEPVLQTMFKALERSASRVFTREVFMLFRSMLEKVGTMKVNLYKHTSTSFIYSVSKYGQPGQNWYVHYYPPTSHWACNCMRMESFGIPCDHIVHMMVYLNIDEMPSSLVLKRWAKSPKKIVSGNWYEGGFIWDSTSMAGAGAILDMSNDDFNDTVEKVRHQIDMLGDDDQDENGASSEDDNWVDYSDFDWNTKLIPDFDESDANGSPSFKRRAQNYVDDECDFDWNTKLIPDFDESDANGSPSFKRRAQNYVDDEW